MKAYLLAGGKGTRLAEITKNEIPKPMAEINGKPILEHIINNLKDNGITDIIISVGYMHEKIEEYFLDGKKFGVNIEYIIEDQPLGSGGALYFLKDKIKERLLICPGDTIFDINISKFEQFHIENNALISVFSHPNIHPYDSDLIITKNNIIKGIDKKNNVRNYYYNNNVIAGVFIIEPETLSFFKELKTVNMEHDFVNYYINTDRVFSYKSCEYIKDIGTVDRFRKTEAEMKKGLVSIKNLKNPQKAIFIDRDGTLNVYKNFITKTEDIELLPNVIEAIKKINQSEYLAIIVSNQPVIARGECSFEDVDNMFKKIETILGLEGAYIDDVYYCPHHPHSGYKGEVKELKIKCDCRKPNIGLLLKAKEKYNIDLSKSYMIGDTNNDIQTAINAGMKSVLVKSPATEPELLNNINYTENILDAVNKILGE